MSARKEIFERALGIKRDEDSRERNQLTYLATVDCAQLKDLYATPLVTVLSDIFDTALICVVLWFIHWHILLIVLLPLIPIYLIARHAGTCQRKIAESLRSNESTYSHRIDHLLTNWLIVRIFSGISYEKREGHKNFQNLTQNLEESNRNLASMMLKVAFLRAVASALAVGISVVYVLRGEIEVGAIATLMLYLTRFYSPALNLAKSYQAVQRGAISAEVIVDFMAQFPTTNFSNSELSGNWENSPMRHSSDSLEWHNLQFCIPTGELLSLPDMPPHSTGFILLTGESGSGKTSFLKSLIGAGSQLRNGKILFGGYDLESLPDCRRYALFSYAGQDSVILPGSLAENIFYPRGEDERYQRHLHVLLSYVGLEHLQRRNIEVSSSKLSGGEARRIVLARALARQAPILIADEVTSNLDQVNQDRIEKLLLEESKKRLVIAVVHRPSAELLSRADYILQFDKSQFS